MVETIMEEGKIAVRRFVKRMGGREAYDRKQHAYLKCAMMTKQSYIHDVKTFILPSGNRWCAYEHTTYESGYANTGCFSFCYYMTMPYGGIFRYAQGKEPAKDGTLVTVDQCVVFDSHFFARLHERGIYEWKGLDTLVQFNADNSQCNMYCTDVDTNKWDVRIYNPANGKSAIGRGSRTPSRNVTYVKTVLADEQLTAHQNNTTSELRRVADASHGVANLNYNVAYDRQMARLAEAIKEGRRDEFLEDQKQRLIKMGCTDVEMARLYKYVFHLQVVAGVVDETLQHSAYLSTLNAVATTVGHITFLSTYKFTDIKSDDECCDIVARDVKSILKQRGRTFSDDAIRREVLRYLGMMRWREETIKQKIQQDNETNNRTERL